MSRPFIGVRWWLGAAFAVVAATSTAIVVSQFSSRSEQKFRSRAEQLAAGNAVLAARQLRVAVDQRTLGTSLPEVARRTNLDLFLYDGTGKLVAHAAARAKPTPLPGQTAAVLRDALAGHRDVTSTSDGRTVVAGLPLATGRTKALVALSDRPDLAAAIAIVSDQALRAGVIAGVIGVLVGLLLAQLIALRLRRLSAAAEALALGDFETPLGYRFRDEFGALAQSFDRMRRQLRRSFRRLEVERDRLRMLLERLHEGVLTIDEDLVVHFANAEARRLLGGRLAEGDELPEPWQGFALREFAQSLFEEHPAPLQVHVSPDAEHAYGLVGIPAQPEIEWALLVIDDLTEQERRELAEREFVSNAAHELRTPLTTIIGAVEVLQAGAKDDPDQRDRFLTHIEREARRLARLARAMLTLARAHSGQEQPRVEPVVAGASAARDRRRAAPARRGDRRGRVPRRPGGTGESRPARAGAAEPGRERGQAHLARPRRPARPGRGHDRGTRGRGHRTGDQRRDPAPRLRPLLPGRAGRRGLRARARDRARVGADARRARRARLVARRGHARPDRPRRRPGTGAGVGVTRADRILLVDDDPGVRDVVAFTLRREGFEVDEERDGHGALEAGRSGRYEIVILDVMLPGLSGTDVCRALRAESDVPILMLTARDAEADRVLGLELGADDYVTKPFSSAELLSRVRAILRRRELDRANGGATVRRLGGLQIDLGRSEVAVDGERVHLTLSEFKVLSLLAERSESVVSRRELMQHLWASEHVGDEHACEVHISNLRRKIERDPTRPERLLTVRGEGYRLVPA